MLKKMTTAIATAKVQEIEALQEHISSIYADVRLNYLGTNNDSVLRNAIEARKKERDEGGYAAGLLESFDVEDVA